MLGLVSMGVVDLGSGASYPCGLEYFCKAGKVVHTIVKDRNA